MQYNFWADLLNKFQNSSELVQAVAIIFAAASIAALLVFLAFIIAKIAEVMVQLMSKKEKMTELAMATANLDRIIYSLIIKYKNSAPFTKEDKTYLEVMQQRLKEGEVIVEFLKKRRKLYKNT